MGFKGKQQEEGKSLRLALVTQGGKEVLGRGLSQDSGWQPESHFGL